MPDYKKWNSLEKPMIDGGANFKCYTMMEIGVDKLIVFPSWRPYLFYLFIIIFVAFSFTISAQIEFEVGDEFFAYALCAVSLFFIPAILNRSTIQVFNTKENDYKKYSLPSLLKTRKALSSRVLLNRIYCIQLIHKTYYDSDNDEVESEEVNLVMQNGERINILEQGHLDHTLVVVNILSSLTGLPIIEVKAIET